MNEIPTVRDLRGSTIHQRAAKGTDKPKAQGNGLVTEDEMLAALKKISRRRLIIILVVGLIMASGGIYFCTTVYDPFAEEIPDVLVLVPDDVKWLMEIGDLPGLLKGVENTTFYSALDRNAGFQSCLRGPEASEGEWLPAVRRAFRQLTGTTWNLPLGLELSDVLGQQVVLAGRGAGADATGVALFRPTDFKVLVAINVLLDATLTDFFATDQLQREGATCTHHGHYTEIRQDVDGAVQVFGLTRIGDVVVVGTDLGMVSQMRLDYERYGAPFRPAIRFRPGSIWEGAASTSINGLYQYGALDAAIGIEENILAPLMGDGIMPMLRRFGPAMVGDDVYLKVQIDEDLLLRAAFDVQSVSGSDQLSRMDPALEDKFQRIAFVVEQLPHYVWGLAWLGARPGNLAHFALNDPGVLDKDKRALWLDEMATRLPRFRGLSTAEAVSAQLKRELDACLSPEVAVAFLRKNRDSANQIPDGESAFILIAPIKDRSRLDDFIAEVSRSLDPKAPSLEHFDLSAEKMSLWRIPTKGFVDDPEITQPGFGIMDDGIRIDEEKERRGAFVFTNWFRALAEDTVAVVRGQKQGSSLGQLSVEELRTSEDASFAPRVFCSLKNEQMHAYFKDASEGWLLEKSQLDAFEEVAIRRGLEQEADRRGIPDEQWEAWIQSQFHVEAARRKGDPRVQRIEMDRRLGYFRDALDTGHIGLHLEDGRLTLSFRVTALEQN